MTRKQALILVLAATLCTGAKAAALPAGTADPAPQASGIPIARKKNPGDLSYKAMLGMQKRTSAMLPKEARLIRPALRLSIEGMDEIERSEFKPEAWGVAIVGKTIEEVLPMMRGGYFQVPSLPQAQARGEDAIVMFNAQTRKNSLDVGWHVTVPASASMPYSDFARALDELRLAQREMPWWDILVRSEKNARFDALRACFKLPSGAILVDGDPAGRKLGAHCSLLRFRPNELERNPAIAFVGELDYVTLDNSLNYPSQYTE